MSNDAPITLPRRKPNVLWWIGFEDGLIGMSLEGIQQSRDVARVLSTRAMWHLGEGRHADAWRDLLAVHRWARLVGQGQMIIEQLVAIAIDGIAAEGTNALLADARLPAQLARQIQQDLAALHPPARMADSFDGVERLYFLDTVVRGHREGAGSFLGSISMDDPDPSTHPLNYVSINWNVVLVKGNAIYDRQAAACRLADHAARRKALAQIENELQQMERQFGAPSNWIGGAMSRDKRSDLLAAAVINLLASATNACANAEDRANATLDHLRLAAALAVYRTQHGQYPESLEALVPDVLPQLPVDFFNGKPFLYQRDGTGFLLYTAGANGIDDDGSNELMSIFSGHSLWDFDESERTKLEGRIPDGADDISIRVPRPPFELPKPPAEE